MSLRLVYLELVKIYWLVLLFDALYSFQGAALSFVRLTCDSFVSIPLVFSFVNTFFQIFFSFFLDLKNPQSVGFSGRPTP